MNSSADTNTPKFSVVIPLFNKELHIKRALDSVLTQTIQDFEIIVVDDGSTDQGANMVRTIQDKRISLIQQTNAGVSVARNSGIKEAMGELIAFLDADDGWRPHFLETIQRLVEKFPEAGAYATAFDIQVSHEKIIHSLCEGIPAAPWEGVIPNYFLSLCSGSPFMPSSVAIPKKVFAEIGGFPVGHHFGEDLVMWGKIALKYPIAFSADRYAIIYKNATNRACQMYYLEQSPVVDFGTKALQNGEVREEFVPYLKECMAQQQILVARECLLFGKNPLRARTALKTISDTVQYRWQRNFWYLLTFIPSSIINLAWRLKRRCSGNQVKEKLDTVRGTSERTWGKV